MRRLLLVPLVLLAACNMTARAEDGAAGPASARSFAAAGFDKVALKGSDDVVVAIGSGFAVRAEGPQPVLDALDIHVSGGTLEIGRKSGAWGWGAPRGHAVVTVTLPALKAVDLAGSGDMRVGAVRAPAFDATLGGSGNLRLDGLSAGEARFDVAGSGNVEVAGTARSGTYAIAGSGRIAAARFATDAASANLAGSGDMAIAARTTAKVSLTGSGDVTVTGGARCTVAKLGSGTVRCG